jgi:glycosyltransferase involved in cell wall biosynthesis
MRSAHHVICVSRWNTEKLKNAYPAAAHKISYIPNGAWIPDAADSSEKILDELNLRSGRYILSVGRLVPEKGFQDLIAAFNRTELDYALVVVGEADHADAFSESLARLASGRVVFAGRRSRGELATLYRKAALFVLPSHHEGHPIVALEALQAGAPILLSDIEPNRDIGFGPQHYFPVGNVDRLVEVLATADFESLRVNDATMLGRYQWNDIAARTVEVVRRVVAHQNLNERERSFAPRLRRNVGAGRHRSP